MALSKAYARFPDHRIEIDEAGIGVKVSRGSTLVAETKRGLNLREGSYPAVVYVPREDVRMDRLERSDHTTHCPFKGDATYYDLNNDLNADDPRTRQIAWSYEDPFDQMLAIRGYLAFYSDRVEIESGED
jgi:uncharacterized protein (DUF427 family)